MAPRFLRSAEKEFCRCLPASADESEMGLGGLIISNQHFIIVELLQHHIDMVGAVVGSRPARRADIPLLVLAERDDLPFAGIPQMLPECDRLIDQRHTDACVPQQNRECDRTAILWIYFP